MFGSSPEALVDKADKLYDSSDYGSAKLTYEKHWAKSQKTLRTRFEKKSLRVVMPSPASV